MRRLLLLSNRCMLHQRTIARSSINIRIPLLRLRNQALLQPASPEAATLPNNCRYLSSNPAAALENTDKQRARRERKRLRQKRRRARQREGREAASEKDDRRSPREAALKGLKKLQKAKQEEAAASMTQSLNQKSKAQKFSQNGSERCRSDVRSKSSPRKQATDAVESPVASGRIQKEEAPPTTSVNTLEKAVVADEPAILRKRRNVSQFIPQWLRREPSWRQRTMALLHLPTDVQETDNRLMNSNFYADSIPSFMEILSNGPPKNLYTACDKLIAAGLSDKETALSYRNMLKSRNRHDEVSRSILNEELRLEKHQRHRDKTAEALKALQERVTELMSPPSEEDNSNNKGFWDQTVQKLTTIFQSDEDAKNATEEQFPFEAKMTQETIERTQEELQRHENAISATQVKLAMLKDEQASTKSTLPEEDFNRIHSAAQAAMPDVTVAFAEHVRNRHSHMLEQYQTLDAKTDLTRPHEWFLHARLDKRKIIYHGGPTNSGKTYTALERLKNAKKGMYYGPLRLLAAEVYEKLTAAGIYCNLYTGQEKREVPFATHGAATVEMALMSEDYDVIVIDEIQMIQDRERGFAWTRALLGTRCKEVHVCGGLEAVDIVKKMVEACGDEFELFTYKRFSDLKIADCALSGQSDQVGSYKMVQPGDCVVAFSRNDIFAIKREIENSTNHKCCVIYGSLPPMTRSEQARRFNDPNSGYDVLVASDAIGMGLNLNIRRIIFNSIYKNDGKSIVRLDHSAMKQISGRAGRRNSPFPVGEVTTRDPRDMDHLRRCLGTEIEPITKAGLLYTANHIETFSEALEQYGTGQATHDAQQILANFNKTDSEKKNQDLHQILTQFNDMASVKSDYFVCKKEDMMIISKNLKEVELSLPDKYLLCMSPVTLQSSQSMAVLKRFANKLAERQVAGLTHSMIPRPAKTFEDLSRLCSIFNELELFLWLQYKFPPGNMMEQLAAHARKEKAIEYISQGLSVTDKLKLQHCYVKRDKRLRSEWRYSQSKSADDKIEDDDEWY